MKRMLLIGIGIVLMVGLVSGAILGVSLIFDNTSFIPSSPPLSKQEGLLTFDCGKVEMQVYINEPDMNWEENDFMPEIFAVCDEEVTDLKDWTNRYYKDNCNLVPQDVCIKSWDEDELSKHTCKYNNATFDKNLNDCVTLDNEQEEL